MSVPDNTFVPGFVRTDDDLLRWSRSVAMASMIAGQPDYTLAAYIYRDPRIATGDRDVQESTFRDEQHPRVPRGEPHAGEFMQRLARITLARTPRPAHDVQWPPGEPDWPDPSAEGQKILEGHKDTYAKWQSDPFMPAELRHENYVPERRALQDEWITSKTSGHASQEQPEALIVAGGTASGKTTLRTRFPDVMPSDAVVIDPDEAKNALPEYGRMLAAGDRYAAIAVHGESGDMVHRLTDRAVGLRQNVVLDTTGNKDAATATEPGAFQKQVQGLLDAGYRVRIVYVNAPTDEAVRGNLARSLATNRHIPENVVRGIHQRVSQVFRDDISKMQGIASISVMDHQHGLVFHREGTDVPVVPHPEAFQQFVAKADEPPVSMERPQPEVIEAADEGVKGPFSDPSKWVIEPVHDFGEFMDGKRLTAAVNSMLHGHPRGEPPVAMG